MESSTRNRIARVTIATVAVALAATTLASAAPSLDLSLPGAANRLSGDQTRAVEKATDGDRAHNVIVLIGDGLGHGNQDLRRTHPQA